MEKIGYNIGIYLDIDIDIGIIATPRICHMNKPAVKHVLFFWKDIAAWSLECEDLKREIS